MKTLTKKGKCSDKDCVIKEVEVGQKGKICESCYKGILKQLLNQEK